MKILVDENIPKMTVEGLRALGHEVKDIRKTSDRGLPDPDLWHLAVTEEVLKLKLSSGVMDWASAHKFLLLAIRV